MRRIVWARFAESTASCAMNRISDGIASAICDRSYPSDSCDLVDGTPSHAERCKDCERILGEARQQEWRAR